jgi:subtilisin
VGALADRVQDRAIDRGRGRIYRGIVSLSLAVVIALPVVVPASAAELTTSPSLEPGTPSAPSGALVPSAGVLPDATDRYIVMLRSGADTAAVVEKASKRDGVKADHTYSKAIRGFAAKLDKHQKSELLADPNVVAVVPDEVIKLTAQTVPTGVSRVGGLLNPIAKIDGIDDRVDADVAILDTGLSPHPDLNIGGGYNCSTSDHAAWRDKNHHGTHVAGTIGALDNGFGVVGVAPGARVWGVKILNDDGDGLISWYVCGLDWVLARRDPNDASRPLFEAVNMSVTKAGSDDHNCGLTNHDALHQAICRVVAGGITVVAAAANEHHNAALNIPASYDEVITVSALADTDGAPGGLGGHGCLSFGKYDVDDTFADFSNYGADVDIMAPGLCILSTVPGPGYATLSGTSMAAPAVTGAVALYKSSRPNAKPAEVREALRFLGNFYWATSTDPDSVHEPLLDVSRLGDLGTFSLTPGSSTATTVEGGTTATVPVTVVRSDTFFERVTFSATTVPDGWGMGPALASSMGWGSSPGMVSVVVPRDTAPGSYDVGVTGANQGRTATTTVTVNVVEDDPTASPPVAGLIPGIKMGLTTSQVRVGWPPATDPTSVIAGYQVQSSKNGGSWTSTVSRTASQRDAPFTVAFAALYSFRVRAIDAGGHWSPWAQAVNPTVIYPVDDRNSSVVRHGTWSRRASATAWRTTLSCSRTAGASLAMTFTGRGVAVVGPTNPQRGKARVYLDGVYVTTVDMKSAAWTSRHVVFARSFSTGGTHVITLRAVGTGTYPLFCLDAFVVLR